jgi:metal-responsive CopG/Arc/MetJ family transcriptional regulator
MGKAVKINITLPEEELSSIDKFVKTMGITRSGLVLKALQSYIQKAEKEEAERIRRMSIKKASSDIKKLREKSGQWDGVAEIRKWRDSR